MEKIEIPAARMPRILNLLGLDSGDCVREIVILPDGGLVTKHKKDKHGVHTVNAETGEFETETLELVFTYGERDYMFSSSVERDGE